jgi:hypothetical protein
MRTQPIARILVVFIAGSEKPKPNISQGNPDTLFSWNESHGVFYLPGGGGGGGGRGWDYVLEFKTEGC